MRRYIVLLLITGILWAQTDFDTLILKSGTTYFGEYSIIEGEIVYFKPQNALAFQPISIKQIQTLKLKDGHFIIGEQLPVAIEDGFSVWLKSKGVIETSQKLSTKEKAIYDAKTNGIFGKISIPKSLTSQDSKMLYEEVYFNKISQRKTRLILGSVAVTVGVAYLISLAIDFSLDFGGGGGGKGFTGFGP